MEASMKRYLLFGFDQYYPEGGWNDFMASFDYWEDAVSAAQEKPTRNYYHVIDSVDGRKVTSGNDFRPLDKEPKSFP